MLELEIVLTGSLLGIYEKLLIGSWEMDLSFNSTQLVLLLTSLPTLFWLHEANHMPNVQQATN